MVKLRASTDSASTAAEGFGELINGGAYGVVLTSVPNTEKDWPKKVYFLSATLDHESVALEFFKKHNFEDEYL